MKALKILSTVFIAIVATPALLVGCSEGAELKIGSLEISPNPVGAGETATVSVEVTNAGDSEETYKAELKIDGAEAQVQEVMVAAEATQRVAFSVVRESLGSYQVEIGELMGTLAVVKPAEFEVGPLESSRRIATTCKPVTIEAEITNAGEAEGTYTAVLQIDGIAVETKDITLGAGEKETVSFEIIREEEGNYNVAIGDSEIILPVRHG